MSGATMPEPRSEIPARLDSMEAAIGRLEREVADLLEMLREAVARRQASGSGQAS